MPEELRLCARCKLWLPVNKIQHEWIYEHVHYAKCKKCVSIENKIQILESPTHLISGNIQCPYCNHIEAPDIHTQAHWQDTNNSSGATLECIKCGEIFIIDIHIKYERHTKKIITEEDVVGL